MRKSTQRAITAVTICGLIALAGHAQGTAPSPHGPATPSGDGGPMQNGDGRCHHCFRCLRRQSVVEKEGKE